MYSIFLISIISGILLGIVTIKNRGFLWVMAAYLIGCVQMFLILKLIK